MNLIKTLHWLKSAVYLDLYTMLKINDLRVCECNFQTKSNTLSAAVFNYENRLCTSINWQSEFGF